MRALAGLLRRKTDVMWSALLSAGWQVAFEVLNFVVDVLGGDQRAAAAFASEIDAFRYAALICGPKLAPMFRRRHDGAMIEFAQVPTPETLGRWIAPAADAGDISLSALVEAKPPRS